MCAGVSSLPLLLIPGVFVFLAFGCLTVLTTVFLANTVDYGELKNNRRDESVIFSMQTFVVKLASGVAALVASFCLQLSNLSDNKDDVVTEAVTGSSVMILRMTMTVLPIIGLIIAIFVFKKHFILNEEKINEINEKLKEKKEDLPKLNGETII